MRPAPRTRRALARGLVAALLATGLLAGCGGDDDGDEGGQPTGTSTAPAEPLVIRVDGRDVDMAGIGTAKPLLADAIRRFGPPGSQREIDGSACHVRWPTGLFAIYANLGGGKPCDPETGRLQGGALTGERWQTAEGLAVGDPEARLHELYPDAVADENRWTLATAEGPGGAETGILSASIQEGKVIQIQTYVGAAGD
jgi:hypothetical protein